MYEVSLPISKSSQETGALLKEYLTKRGLAIVQGSDVVISYGCPGYEATPHVLNRLKGRGKIYNMQVMNAAGVRTVPWFDGANLPANFRFPALARKVHGYGGTDIVPVFQADEIPWRVQAGWSWFSSYVPVESEYRVWVFRGEVLDVYTKVMERPEEFKHIGRNFRNGFEFQHLQQIPQDAAAAGLAVNKALGYDFAAVDMLRGQDGLIYVLETNSAPGVIKSGAQATLGKLADRMVNWVESGCPEWK